MEATPWSFLETSQVENIKQVKKKKEIKKREEERAREKERKKLVRLRRRLADRDFNSTLLHRGRAT